MTGKVPKNQTEYDLETATSAAIKIAFPLPRGRGDQVRNGDSGPDLRELPPRAYARATSTSPTCTSIQ